MIGTADGISVMVLPKHPYFFIRDERRYLSDDEASAGLIFMPAAHNAHIAGQYPPM